MNTEDKLKAIAEKMNGQDHLCTTDPIYCVYQVKRVWGFDSEFCDDWAWIDSGGDHSSVEDGSDKMKEIIAEWKEHNPNSDLDDEEIMEDRLQYFKGYYKDETVAVGGQVYFSRIGAQNHIDANHYHYNKPFVYVESAWRNPEFQAVREFLEAMQMKTQSEVSK